MTLSAAASSIFDPSVRSPYRFFIAVFVTLLTSWTSFPAATAAQISIVHPSAEEQPPAPESCGLGLKFYDSPFFRICYPKRWHIIRGYATDYAWWVFSKRKHGERFDRPYLRVIIAKGIAESHLSTQADSVTTNIRQYTKATNVFKDVTGKKLDKRFWREISVGPDFDVLAWYEQIKKKNLPLFNRALDSFWVPPPPRPRPSKTEQ
ncbi:MAG: hypothetical protein PHX83_15720 [Acidobacteriia bacterium]|nr:hypothetical protein [Terriglobia bacterium]